MRDRTMDDATRAALEASIEHWKRNAAAEEPGDVELGPDDCALCQAFPEDCDSCPVKLKTGQPNCVGSPYGEVAEAWLKWDNGLMVRITDAEKYSFIIQNAKEKFQESAQKEVEFLESLRKD